MMAEKGLKSSVNSHRHADDRGIGCAASPRFKKVRGLEDFDAEFPRRTEMPFVVRY